MITMHLDFDKEQRSAIPKEGDLYKVIRLCGVTFELRYGFYEENDRYAQHAEPVEIYPDLIKNPQYTDDGIPFVTQMQLPCEYFVGKWDENAGCGDCACYRHGDELLGICSCQMNRKSFAKKVVQNE